MKILIVEDGVPMARAFESLLTAAGHQVSRYVGARSLESLVLFTENGSDQQIDPRDFDLAYCDGQLEGSIEGPAIVAVLASAGVTCTGISTMKDYNDRMLAAGAKLAYNKAVALLALLSGLAPADLILSDVEAVKARQSQIDEAVKNKDLRKQADALVMSFM